MEDVRLGCGVAGRFPRGGERGAAAGRAPGFRLAKRGEDSSRASRLVAQVLGWRAE